MGFICAVANCDCIDGIVSKGTDDEDEEFEDEELDEDDEEDEDVVDGDEEADDELELDRIGC